MCESTNLVFSVVNQGERPRAVALSNYHEWNPVCATFLHFRPCHLSRKFLVDKQGEDSSSNRPHIISDILS